MNNGPAPQLSSDEPRPVIDKARIKDLVTRGADSDAVREHHGSIHHRFYERRFVQIRKDQAHIDRHITVLEARLEKLRTHLDILPPFVPDPNAVGSSSRWDNFSKAYFVLGLLLLLILLTISINIVASFVINSGLVFDWAQHPWKAYFISALPWGLPVVLHLAYERLSPRYRDQLYHALGIATSISGLAWICSYCLIFAKFGQSDQSASALAEKLASATVDTTHLVEFCFVFSQLVTELLISTLVSISLHNMIRSRRALNILNKDDEVAWTHYSTVQLAHEHSVSQSKDISIQAESLNESRERFIQEALGYYHELNAIQSQIQEAKLALQSALKKLQEKEEAERSATLEKRKKDHEQREAWVKKLMENKEAAAKAGIAKAEAEKAAADQVAKEIEDQITKLNATEREDIFEKSKAKAAFAEEELARLHAMFNSL